MSGVLRIALVDPDDASREQLKQLLLGVELVWLEAECSRLEFFLDIVAQSRPDIAIVSMDPEPARAIALLEKITAQHPSCAVVAVSNATDSQQILAAMRAGAKEFLQRPVSLEDVLQAIQRLGHGRPGNGDTQAGPSRVITVIGASGGVGTTTVAVNLACSLAQSQNQSVGLVDLDLAVGDADICLDLLPDYTLADVSSNIERLDMTLLKRSLAKHASGVFLLSRPMQLEECGSITGDQVKRVLGLLKATFGHVIIDTSKNFAPPDIKAMEVADDILLVTQLDLPCLRNVVRILMALGQADGLAGKVKVVLNRLGLEDGEISVKKAEETIGRDIYWQVPNDWRTVVSARNNGVPLITHAPRSKVNQAICALGVRLNGGEAEVPVRRRGLLSFLR